MHAVDCMTRRELAVTQFPAAVTQISTAVMPAELAMIQLAAAITQSVAAVMLAELAMTW
jgi:hypothetical protein